ncbi:MAG: PrsW family intramembrane metalloprotease [bacterium]|nr:PrsW family intramembrane metalloprotease [bacterium]
MSIGWLIGLGLAPSIIWLIFYLQEDRRHPEPIRLIFYAFLVGGIVTFFVLVMQIVLRQYLGTIGISPRNPIELFLFSGIEEVMKFAAVYIFISRRRDFNEPMDAMVYMITVALGFAAVENIASLGQHQTSLITGISGLASIEVLALRFFGATLLHSLTAAVVGYHWGHALARGKDIGLGITLGLGIAILLHAAFNYLILIEGPITWALSFVIFIGFFVIGDFERLKREDNFETE